MTHWSYYSPDTLRWSLVDHRHRIPIDGHESNCKRDKNKIIVNPFLIQLWTTIDSPIVRDHEEDSDCKRRDDCNRSQQPSFATLGPNADHPQTNEQDVLQEHDNVE